MGRESYSGNPKLFDIFFREGEEEDENSAYYIFAPAGCVLVDGKEAVVTGAVNGNVKLDIDPDEMPDYIYGHVTITESAGEGTEIAVTFDDEEEKDGAKFNFKVARFGSDGFDGNDYDLATSVVSLSTGKGETPKGNFEPVFVDGVLHHVDYGFWPYGRQFYMGVTVANSAKVSTGFIGLQVDYTYPNSPTAAIVKIADDVQDVSNLNLGTTTIPLYMIEDGKIVYDFRSVTALAIRE